MLLTPIESTGDDQVAKRRKNAILIGQIGGFGTGLAIALLLGTDSRITAVSGMVLGTAAGSLIQTQYSLWTRVGVSLIAILSVTYVWWPE